MRVAIVVLVLGVASAGGCASGATEGGPTSGCPSNLSDAECARHERWFDRMIEANCSTDARELVMIALIDGYDDRVIEHVVDTECEG